MGVNPKGNEDTIGYIYLFPAYKKKKNNLEIKRKC
jgi:hypothetical protein